MPPALPLPTTPYVRTPWRKLTLCAHLSLHLRALPAELVSGIIPSAILSNISKQTLLWLCTEDNARILAWDTRTLPTGAGLRTRRKKGRAEEGQTFIWVPL